MTRFTITHYRPDLYGSHMLLLQHGTADTVEALYVGDALSEAGAKPDWAIAEAAGVTSATSPDERTRIEARVDKGWTLTPLSPGPSAALAPNFNVLVDEDGFKDCALPPPPPLPIDSGYRQAGEGSYTPNAAPVELLEDPQRQPRIHDTATPRPSVFLWGGDGDGQDLRHWSWDREDSLWMAFHEGTGYRLLHNNIFSLAPADQEPEPLTTEEVKLVPTVTELPAVEKRWRVNVDGADTEVTSPDAMSAIRPMVRLWSGVHLVLTTAVFTVNAGSSS